MPSPNLWRQLGGVNALPLPMACTLTEINRGIKYYFAIRAQDEHSRVGLFSEPQTITLP